MEPRTPSATGGGVGVLLDGINGAIAKWRTRRDAGLDAATKLMNAVITLQHVDAEERGSLGEFPRSFEVRRDEARAIIAASQQELLSVLADLGKGLTRVRTLVQQLERTAVVLVADHPLLRAETIVRAAKDIQAGLERELVAKALIVDQLPTTTDRSLALTYLMAWNGEPMLDLGEWKQIVELAAG